MQTGHREFYPCDHNQAKINSLAFTDRPYGYFLLCFRYDDNGGTIVSVAGEDYCIIAGSKRLSTGYSILTRDQTKILKL